MGNQMFMYAAGLATALRLNTELVLDSSFFASGVRTDRPYQLSCFPEITERKASFADTWKLSPGLAVFNALTSMQLKKHHIFRRIFRRIMKKTLTRLDLAPIGYFYFIKGSEKSPFPYPYKFSRTYIENKAYRDRFNEIPDNSYISGYWESESYFADYADAVRKKFRFPPECFDPVLSEKIRSCNSVAIHVRRGDRARFETYRVKSARYLNHAIERITSLTEKPEFFVFSDDIEWCKENMHKIHEAEYHFIEGQTPAQDMALMSICKHVIMGMSTFSWWGAWLNENPKKIVIAPDRESSGSWYPYGAIVMD